MRKFCVLRALLNSMILMKLFFLKSTTLNKKFFVKSMNLNKTTFDLSDFVSAFLQCVRFGIKNITTRQILERKNLPKSTTCTFHIVFLHITLYSYRLQNPPQLDNSNRLRSYKAFCTLFRKDFHV